MVEYSSPDIDRVDRAKEASTCPEYEIFSSHSLALTDRSAREGLGLPEAGHLREIPKPFGGFRMLYLTI
jgi:hypothetical protein